MHCPFFVFRDINYENYVITLLCTLVKCRPVVNLERTIMSKYSEILMHYLYLNSTVSANLLKTKVYSD